MHVINVIFCKAKINFQNFYNILDSILDSSRKNSDSDRLESKYQSIISWTNSTQRQKFLTHLGSTREILDSIHDYLNRPKKHEGIELFKEDLVHCLCKA